MTTATIPAFAYPATPGALALFETLALAGLEGQWIELSLSDQRRIMGAPVFGYAAILLDSAGTLHVDPRTHAAAPVIGTYTLAMLTALVASAAEPAST